MDQTTQPAATSHPHADLESATVGLSGSQEPDRDEAIIDHWIELPRGRLFARSWRPWAPGPAILLFHDSLGCIDLWRDFPERLARTTGRRVVAYDRLGFGRSDPHPGRLPGDFIRSEAKIVVAALREQLSLGSLIAIGHSVGGAMAVAAAARDPGSCTAVVTVSALAFVENCSLAGIRQARETFRNPAQFERLTRYHGGKAQWVLDAWTETWLAPSFAEWSLDEELKGVRCPLLAIHGDRDEYGSRHQPERMSVLASGPSEAATLEKCGHFPHREQPDQLLGALARFLNRHAAGAVR